MDAAAKKERFVNMLAYCLGHALVDAACAATLFAMIAQGKNGPDNFFQMILVFDVIAFCTQPIFGLLVDQSKAPARLAALGILLVMSSTLLMRVPILAAVTAAIGNAIFHAAGGAISLDLTPGKATLPGIFVAPGAMGLTIGILIGKSGHFLAWPFLLLLAGTAALILAVPQPAAPTRQEAHADLRWFESILLLLLLSVGIRSLVGQSLVLPWKSDPAWLVILTMAVVLGKALGGILADQFGWSVIAVSGLAVSAPLLAFFSDVPAAAVAGIFLFNLSMPVTLVGVAQMLPGKSGFAFGLTTFALIAGALPAFTPLHTVTGTPGFIFATILVSIIALWIGLRLLDRSFSHPPALKPDHRGSENQ